MQRTRHIACIIATLIVTMSIPRIAAGQTQNAVLNFFIGDVKVWSVRDSSWKDAILKQVVFEGDSIRTAPESRAEVKCGEDVIRIGERSQIVIEKMGGKVNGPDWRILLLIGKMWANAVKLFNDEPTRQVGTPSALAAIRGTVYRVSTDEKNTTEVAVYEGSVEVRPQGEISHPPARPLVALLPLAPTEATPADAMALTNRLHTELLRRDRLALVERDRVDELLKEQGLTQTGCFTSECIAEMGSLLGVRFVIAGSVSRIGQTYTIDARRIDIETDLIEGFSNITYTGSIDGVMEQMANVAMDLAPAPEKQSPATVPRRVPGPRRVSYDEWMEILDAMQRIVVAPDGSREVSGFSIEDEANDEWIQFNLQRDRALEAERNQR